MRGRAYGCIGSITLAAVLSAMGAARGQGYYSQPGQGYYYNPSGGYYYPTYSYGYQTRAGTAASSGYYSYDGNYYYYSYPSQGAAAEPPRPAPAADSTARLAAMEARIRTLEERLQRAESNPPVQVYVPATPAAEVAANRDYSVERDPRYPNWRFDYNDWMAHNW